MTPAVMNKLFGEPLCYRYERYDADVRVEQYIMTPFEEKISSVTPDPYTTAMGYMYAEQLSFIDIDSLFIRAFIVYEHNPFGSPGPSITNSRIYKGNISIMGEILSAVGTTEDNILGLVYIPSTDRLNK
jgi:hypothetical protein